MGRASVNPDMDLKKGSVPNPSSPKSVGAEGRRDAVNPPMDLSEPANAPEANTGGAVNTGNRVAVNPDMDLSKGPADGAPEATEKSSATMPGVGNMPTGEKAAKKNMPL
ncbi:MAG: hypothetical protein GY861_17530 [bacterium]|nr:hypothetical protein [bacterium]